MRRLYGSERFFLAGERLDPRTSVFQLVAEGRGELPLEAVEAAVRKAAAANPGLSLYLRGSLGWARWLASDVPPPVTLIEAPDWDCRSPAGGDRFLYRRLDVRRGPACEVLLVRGTRNRVIVRAHHALTDGGGALEFLLDVFRELRGESALGSPPGPRTCLDLVREIPRGAKGLPQPRYAPITGAPEEAAPGQTWRRVTVKLAGSRVLPRLIEALIVSASGYSNGPWRIGLPVDLRRRLPGLRTSANVTGGIDLEGGLEDFRADAVAEAIRQMLDAGRELKAMRATEKLRWLPLGLLTQARRAGLRRTAKSGKVALSAMVSNLGRQSLRSIEAPGWEPTSLFLIPAGTTGLPLALSTSGHEGGLELIGTAPHAFATRGRLERTLEEIRNRLEAVAEDRTRSRASLC